ncbi:hypothetical protein BT63DRAFT_427903 [Microthyrium microscopicum]|uniref:Uncharacterized protein n=1 Tax=Microthyrium microscopicum TaxID=703497 RepID=A0A6A6U4Q1_9PEZI|nr:hypothetical protein BT63DRAFT_427903 [Microthyrium microscopicum]
MERTLDEAYYPGLGREILKLRNKDQVVTRSVKSQMLRERGQETIKLSPIVLVPQLWLWRLDDIVVSAFPERENISLWHTEAPRSLYMNPVVETVSPDLQLGLIIAYHVEEFANGYQNLNVTFPPVLNIFETEVVSILSEVDNYMRVSKSSLPNIEVESGFMHDISDIRDELAMIQDVLSQQEDVLADLVDDADPTRNITSEEMFCKLMADGNVDKEHSPSSAQFDQEAALWERVHHAQKSLVQYRKRIEKIDRDAERLQQLVQSKLDLKRTFASMQQAETSIQEARDSKLLSLVVIGFTIVTIIFTPLSFMVGLFALDIDQLSGLKRSDEGGTDVYSGSTLAGIFSKLEHLTLSTNATLILTVSQSE